jgi:hypothetical protein
MKRLFLLPLLCIVLLACAQDPNAAFIQGHWTALDPGASRAERFEWAFENGQFFRLQELNRGDPLVTEGQYRVIQSEGDRIVILLYNITDDRISYENNDMEVRIDILREEGLIEITNTPFERISP